MEQEHWDGDINARDFVALVHRDQLRVGFFRCAWCEYVYGRLYADSIFTLGKPEIR